MRMCTCVACTPSAKPVESSRPFAQESQLYCRKSIIKRPSAQGRSSGVCATSGSSAPGCGSSAAWQGHGRLAAVEHFHSRAWRDSGSSGRGPSRRVVAGASCCGDECGAAFDTSRGHSRRSSSSGGGRPSTWGGRPRRAAFARGVVCAGLAAQARCSRVRRRSSFAPTFGDRGARAGAGGRLSAVIPTGRARSISSKRTVAANPASSARHCGSH